MFILRTVEYGELKLQFSRTGEYLLVSDEVWSLADRVCVQPMSYELIRGEWSPVADELCVPRDHEIQFITPRGEPVRAVKDVGWYQGLVFAPSGDRLFTFCSWKLTGWKLVRGKWRSEWCAEIKKTGPLKNDSFESLAVVPDGTSLLTLTVRRHHNDGYTPYRTLLVRRDTSTGEVLSEQLIGDKDAPLGVGTRLSIAPDESQVIGFRARSVIAWPTEEGKPARRTPVSKKDVRDVALHPSGRWALVANGSPEVSVWDTTTWKCVRAFNWKIGDMHCAAFSPDGLLAAVTGETGKVAVWDWDV